jgi:cytochrome b involved in lipid metabolism
MLSDKYEDDADDTVNYQHISHINLKSEFKRTMYIGGGADATKFSQSGGSIPVAATFDDENVHIVHSRTGKTNSNNVLKEYPTLYHAAAALGRAAGATAQTPMTFKDLDFTMVKHILSEDERKTAIQAGVQHLRSVDGISGLVVNLDGNTKQRNKQDIYADGTSPFGSIVRIKNLLNRTIAKNCRVRFVGQNANLASPADVKSYIETILSQSTCTKTEDNLILSSKNVKAVLNGSDYRVTYGFVPNGPVNRLFITGTMFNVSAAA